MIAVEFDNESRANLQHWIDTLHDLSHILISVFDPQFRLIFTTEKNSSKAQEEILIQRPPRSSNRSTDFRLLDDGTAEAVAPVFTDDMLVGYALISRFYLEPNANPHDTILKNNMPVLDGMLSNSILSLIALGIKHCLRRIVTIDSELRQKVDSFITDNLNKKITLRILSDALSVGVEDLRTFFRMEPNGNLPNYLRGKRVEEAKKLLSQTDMSLTQISEIIGLGEDKWIPLFVKAVAATPEQYRAYNRA